MTFKSFRAFSPRKVTTIKKTTPCGVSVVSQDTCKSPDHTSDSSDSVENGRSITSNGEIRQGPRPIKEFQRLNPKTLYKVPLVQVECSFGAVKEREEHGGHLRSLVQQQQHHQGSKVTVVFAIRRPGCGSCRDHARQVVSLKDDIYGINLMGVTKHGQGVDDDAMLEFYQEYFHQPIYKDDKWRIFDAMGGRKISLPKLLYTFPKMTKRYNDLGIENIPFGGDIRTQGGLLIFDRKGQLRFVYYENYGDRLDLDMIREAIKEVMHVPASSNEL